MLWVLQGEQLWQQAQGREDVACSGCHDDARQTMRGVAARYPAFDAATGRPIDLAGDARTGRHAAAAANREWQQQPSRTLFQSSRWRSSLR
ncbi:hypothetical protein [Mesorhizobium muleiense]